MPAHAHAQAPRHTRACTCTDARAHSCLCRCAHAQAPARRCPARHMCAHHVMRARCIACGHCDQHGCLSQVEANVWVGLKSPRASGHMQDSVHMCQCLRVCRPSTESMDMPLILAGCSNALCSGWGTGLHTMMIGRYC